MSAPFGLGSSVTYYLNGRDNKQGMKLVRMSEARPGDIAIWSGNGDPLDGGGAGGHTAVIEIVHGHNDFTCMESYGHHGVGRKRRSGFWMWIVRVEGMTTAHLQQMSALTDRCVANRIQYYAGASNTDGDWPPDRADLNNYMHPWAAIGVDCSGFAWALFDCAWLYVRGGSSIPTTPIPGEEDDMTPEQERKLDAIYDAVFKGETASILRDINARLVRAWEYNPLDPYSAPLLKVADLHVIAGALRDGFINSGTATAEKFTRGIRTLRRNAFAAAVRGQAALQKLGVEDPMEKQL